jgi:hypothetical protein
MGYILLPLLLSVPLLLAMYYWFTEEYSFTGKMLSAWQCMLLTTFVLYSGYCLYSGVDSILLQFKDYAYPAGRALSFPGMWSYVVPGLIAPMLIFPKETLCYILKQTTASKIEPYVIVVSGSLLLLLILIRHLAVI